MPLVLLGDLPLTTDAWSDRQTETDIVALYMLKVTYFSSIPNGTVVKRSAVEKLNNGKISPFSIPTKDTEIFAL